MQALSNTSRIIADELRKAERSINLATRDTAQFLLTTLDATEAHRLSPAMTQRTVKARSQRSLRWSRARIIWQCERTWLPRKSAASLV